MARAELRLDATETARVRCLAVLAEIGTVDDARLAIPYLRHEDDMARQAAMDNIARLPIGEAAPFFVPPMKAVEQRLAQISQIEYGGSVRGNVGRRRTVFSLG